MKKQLLILPICMLGAFSFFSVQISVNSEIVKFDSKSVHKNSNGSPTGKTGAPGESAQACTGCHAGSVIPGANQNIFKVFDGATEVTAYIPGVTYQVSLGLASGNAREGFSATVLLNSDDTAAGSFPGSGLVGTSVTSAANGRDYATHTISSNMEGNATWEWDWTAPAIEEGPVTFYVASNKANGNGTTGGDEIYVSQHMIASTLGIGESKVDAINFNSGYNAINNELMISYSSLTTENAFVKIVDLSGKSVFTRQLGASEIGVNKKVVKLKDEISHGSYVIQFFLGNTPVAKNIIL